MHRVPRESERPSELLAAALRDAPPELDDFARARLERNLVDAWRTRGARAVALPHTRGWTRGVPAWVFQVSASVVIGALLGIYALRVHDTAPNGSDAGAQSVVAHFELVIDDGAVQSGYITEGQVLESGKHGHIEVALAQSRVDIAPESRVRFERLAPDELRLSLVKGRVEVAFHPEHKGRDRMSIETRAARVLVVGTRFDVDADASGNTVVSVSEGVVQVVPRRGGEPRFLRAGEHLEVLAQDAASDEQAVREAMEKRIAAEGVAAHEDGAANDDEQDALEQAPDVVGARGDGVEASRRSASPDDVSPERRLEAARELLMQGKHAAARERLQKLAKSALPTGARVEALTLIAESFTAQGQIPRATEAYREAVRIAPRHPAAHNALFALARLIERYTEDKSAAGATYRAYLQAAPSGALAPQAREALCRLGDAADCE